MRKLLCLIMALLLAFGTASFADEAETDSLEMILSGMTLRDKVCQMDDDCLLPHMEGSAGGG